ncbi:MAG: hypothetical protein IKY27_11090 [Bacteroidales bacterium]|nr:hypothetical protein [Bacteroidales bacterium]
MNYELKNMPFIEELIKYKSCSIVGLEKNTGKTECFNYVMQRLPLETKRVAVSSIGIDGETTDQVTKTAKPEIFLREGMYFGTSEKHYLMKRLSSELLEISDESTSLGNIVIGKALTPGKILLSGPSSSSGLVRWMDEMKKYDIDLTIIDGALSRMSLASPTVSESMILATGAAYSANINTLVQKTAFVVQMINLDITSQENCDTLNNIKNGVWAIDEEGELHDLKVASSLSININTDGLKKCKTLFVSGALTDNFVNNIRQNRIFNEAELVVRDFTKIFLTPMTYNSFVNGKRKISVLQKSKLIAVCVNPTSPNGIILDSEKLCNLLSEAIKLPVYDLKKNVCNSENSLIQHADCAS